MTVYIIKRLLALIPVLIGVSLIIFGIMQLIPGDAAEVMVGTNGSAADVERIRETLGLNKPIYEQYWLFISRAAVGNFGRSTQTGRPALTEFSSRVKPTAELAAAALILAIFFGMLTGIVSAILQYSVWDYLVTVVSLIGVSAPIFWTGLMMMLLFSVWLGWLPATGSGSFSRLIMPALALGSASTAIIARQMRSGLLEVLRQDYVRTARAKGLREWTVIARHAVRNALIPTVTVVGLQFGYLLGGSVLTETVFARPGVGSFLVNSIQARDIPVVQATIMLLAVAFLVVNLLVDLLYAVLDPRIRYS
jgi:ABC-type dipeptide/oligopeptide/nickel transport system permease component